jgi:hypothetical protein
MNSNVIPFPARNVAPSLSSGLLGINELITGGKTNVRCHTVQNDSGELKGGDIAFVDYNRFDGLLYFMSGRAVGTIVYILRSVGGAK